MFQPAANQPPQGGGACTQQTMAKCLDQPNVGALWSIGKLISNLE
jgi:hypothetical protein